MMAARTLVLLAMLGVATGAAAQEIGRVFTTPAERAALEQIRAGGKARPETGAYVPPPPPPVEGEQVLEVSGVVTRSGSGRATTFIDAQSYNQTARLDSGVAIARGSSGSDITLTLHNGKKVVVKAGQQIDAVSGKLIEGSQSGALRITRTRR
jgi:hypothetical protein